MSLAVPALPVTGGITTLSGRSTRRPSRRAVVAAASARGEQGMGPRRVVALHGKGGDGERMLAGLQPLVEAAGAEMEWVCPTAPHAVRGGHAWWLTAPGERSFEALEWEGIEKSIAAVEALYPFDALLGYSQGAMLAAVLAARGAQGLGPCNVPAVIGSAAWPLPFDKLLKDLQSNGTCATLPPTLHTVGAADDVNPPLLALQVADCFGEGAEVLTHPGGHWIPMEPDHTARIAAFLQRAGGGQ